MPETHGLEADESPELKELAAALAKAQAAIRHADKSRAAPVNREGTKTRKYATLADVMEAARPSLTANGLAVVQHPSGGEGGLVLTTWLLHESGQWMRSRLAIPYAGNAFMSDVQALGSAITYARRYAYAAIAGVAVEDDDGEATKSEEGEPARGATPATATHFPNFGKAKNGPIAGASIETLESYLASARRALADESKARWHAKESALIGAIEAELARQRGAQPEGQRETKAGPAEKPSRVVDQQPDESEDHAKQRQAGAFYAKAVKAGANAGWSQADVGKWLREQRGRGGQKEVTAEDAELFCRHLEPPPEPGAQG